MRGYSIVVFSLLLTAAGGAELSGQMVFEPTDQADRYVGRGAKGVVSLEASGFTVRRGAARVRGRFLGAQANAPLRGSERLRSQSHYLRGADWGQWRTGVPNFGRVSVAEIYPGIDIEYYQAEGRLEFDLTLEPGVQCEEIRMAFEGVETLELDDSGALVLKASGETLRQLAPRVLQRLKGEEVTVASRYRLLEDRIVAFEIGDYDKSLPLVIDPVLEWATFLGGSGQDQVNAVAVDTAGFVYVAGFTTSTNFPTADPFDGQMDGAIDGFVSKLSPDGTQLIWSTYLGGSLRDEVRGLKVDAQGNVYVSGPTESADFPTTNGAAQRALGGAIDSFVSKLTPAGDGLIYSTLFGGPGAENGKKLDIDASGGVYLTGEIGSADLPSTPGAFQPAFGGSFDVFVAKLNPAGSAVEWASYFGGDFNDQLFDIETDPSGGVIIAGSSQSSDLQGTANAFQRTRAGNSDGFIARFTADGSAVDYFTFLGGSFVDSIRGIALDGAGNIWAAGGTASNDLPVTDDAANASYAGSGTDGFIARLPLPSRIVPGPPVMAPYVSYVGDEDTNFGLDVAISRRPASAALSAEGVPQAFGDFAIFYSLSNFTDADGSFGKIIEHGPDGQPIDTVTLPGADANASAVDPRGNGAVFAGVGLANGQTTAGTVQPSFGGGTGTLPADGFVVRTAPAIAEPTGRTSLRVVKTLLDDSSAGFGFDLTDVRCQGLAVNEPVAFFLDVTNVGAETARNVQLTDRGVNLDFPHPRAALTSMPIGFNANGEPEVERCKNPKRLRGSVTCELGDMFPGEKIRVFATGTVTAREFSNTATAVADNADLVASDTIVGNATPQVSLSLVKELADPTVTAVEPGQRLTYRLTVTNESFEDPARCVFLSEQDSQGLKLQIVNPAPRRSDRACGPQMASRFEVPRFVCFAEVLAPRESFSILADFIADRAEGFPANRDFPVYNRATAKALNSDVVEAAAATRIPGEGNADEPLVCGASSADGSDVASVGQNDLKAALPPVDTTCWVRDQPDSGVLPIQVSADMGIDPANQLNPDGTYSGMGFIVIGEDGQPFEVPVRPGPTAGTLRTETFDAPVRHNTFGLSLNGFTINATNLTAPTRFLFGFSIQTADGEIIPLNAPLQVIPGREVVPKISADFELQSYFLGIRLAMAQNETLLDRIVLQIEDLPTDATTNPIPSCISATPPPAANGSDEPRAPVFAFLRYIAGADQHGMGGQPFEDCDPVTPQIVNGRMTTAWAVDSLFSNIGETVIEFFLPFGFEGAQFGNVSVTAGLGPYLPEGANPAEFPAPLYRRPEPIAFSVTAPTPAVTSAGVVSAASNLTLSHGLGAIFGGDLASQTGVAGALPLPQEINGSRVYVLSAPEDFSGLAPEGKAAATPRVEQSGGYFAPLLFVSPSQINFQLPWEVDLSSGFVDLQVIRDGIANDPVRVAVSEFSPALFSFDFGPGRAIAINPDGSVAHPTGSFGGAVPSRPVRRGEALILLASGLGPVTPPGVTGSNSLDAAGDFVRRDTVQVPRVTIGGVEQQVLFSGLSPEFAGVYQLNVLVTDSAPVGDQQTLVIEIGGVRSREDVTIAVAP